MAPLLVSVLTTLGPALLRALGKRKGGLAAQTAEVVASTIEAQSGKPKADADKSISNVVLALPPEQRAELLSLVVEGEKVKADLEAKKIAAETAQFESEQQTHRLALQSSDVYTVRTRPLIARWSFYISAGYAIIYSSVPIIWPNRPVEFGWEFYLAMATPALTYMGVRSLDKVASFFKRK